MSSKESQHSKETLKENSRQFDQLENTVEAYRNDLKKKMLKEINELDEQERKKAQQLTARRKALALKSLIRGSLTQDDENPYESEVPIDGEIKPGTIVFMKNCSVCHSLDGVDAKLMRGPSLGLIFNRRVGSNMNFQQYSSAMLKSSFFWTAKNLYKFMGNAKAMIPGTTCGLTVKPLVSEEYRADLITFFREFTVEMAFNIRLKQIERIGYTAFQTSLHVEKEQRARGKARDKIEKDLSEKK